MKKLKEHFKNEYQLLLTESQLIKIAQVVLEDLKPEQRIEIDTHGANDIPQVTDPQL